jgi:spore maturation protein CgeB
MKIALFYHSLVSDWNHGNAHFLRGIAWELQRRGHELCIFEPADGWSLTNLMREHGRAPIDEFYRTYPGLRSVFYEPKRLDVDRALKDVDLAVVHEWNDSELVREIGAHRKAAGHYRLLFHDTHHRSATQPESMASYDLSGYDGVLAYGQALCDIYLRRGWTARAWVWHEAADVWIFRPILNQQKEGDLVWIGNWGDEERTAEMYEFLLGPVKSLGLNARVYGVRYPAEAREALSAAGIEYGGWLPNFRVPDTLARFRVTVHIPRRPYVESLPGIPTIRPFEALACGIPLICSPWADTERLFKRDKDYLTARDGAEMKQRLLTVLSDRKVAQSVAAYGRRTILQRHTCAHRVDELMAIYNEIRALPNSRAAQDRLQNEPREEL